MTCLRRNILIALLSFLFMAGIGVHAAHATGGTATGTGGVTGTGTATGTGTGTSTPTGGACSGGATGTGQSAPVGPATMCPDNTGPKHIQKPFEPTSQGSYCDVRGQGARAHKGVDMMQKEGFLAPRPPGCKIMMNGNSPIWCQGNPYAVSGYGWYMRFACGRRMVDGKEYKIEVRYAHVKGYDATQGMAINSCSGCVGIPPHVHYEVVVEGHKVNPVCVWGTGVTNRISCPGGLSKPADLCDPKQLKILRNQACHCPGFQCGGPGATTSMAYSDGVDPTTLSGMHYPPSGGCGGQGSGGSPHRPDAAGSPGSGGGATGGTSGDGPPGDGGRGTPNPGYIENEEGCFSCCCPCSLPLISQHQRIRRHVDIIPSLSESSEFEEHRKWLAFTFFQEHILRAMQQMTSQLTTVGVEQVRIVGAFFDAKHQLETQRLFQRLSVRAHKDYTPSEGLCEFGTVTRSLLASERRADAMKLTLAQHSLKRQLGSGEIVSAEGGISDRQSRLKNFVEKYCDKNDNSRGLNLLCKTGNAPKDRQNRDVDYVRSLETKMTLDIDITKDGAKNSADMENMAALSANLFAHNVFPVRPRGIYANDKGEIRIDAVPLYMDMRSIAAKRSVAVNSFAAIAGERVAGDPEAAPFIKRLIAELGVPEADVDMVIGKNPSYFAQMEVLTKKIYENPVFYTELYDKPVNIDRKAAALKAIGLMQDRDIYQSLLRSEMVGSVLLETLLMKQQDKLHNFVDPEGTAGIPVLDGAGSSGSGGTTP